MKGDFHFQSAQRDWENPTEFEEATRDLPSVGVCPWCLVELESDGDEISCPNTLNNEECWYDSSLTEDQNRVKFQGGGE